MFRSRLARRPGAAGHYPSGFLDALADRLRGLAQPGRTTLVAIDGWGCGGKTALCEGLLDRLEPDAVYLGVDEFFFAYPFPPLDPFPTAHLRWSEIERTVGELRATGRTSFRPFDWEVCEIGAPVTIEAPLVVVEGLFSHAPTLRPAYDFTIWVQGWLETRPERVAARDGAHMIPFWKDEWDHRERAWFAVHRPWDSADIVVAGAEVALADLRAAIGAALADPGSTAG